MEQEELPKDLLPKCLDIDEQNSKVTITLGDGVDLNEIVEYLRSKNIVSRTSNKPDEYGNLTYNSDNYNITFTINGKKKTLDQYSHTISNNNIFYFNINEKCIWYATTDDEISMYSDRLKIRSLTQDATANKTEPFIVKNTILSLSRDSRGNLSWYQINKDGKVYMRNHFDANEKQFVIINNNYPSAELTKPWKPIKNTYVSNIRTWWGTNINDYDDVEENDRPSSMKRLGRVLIGQDNMTGECLWSHGCLSCCGSGYNEEPFYNTENLSDKLNILNEQ